MYATQQQCIIPRWNGWAPLATQQFRLRNLIKIQAINVGREDFEGRICGQQYLDSGLTMDFFYYTLHLSELSAPFYTSEKIQSDNPKWKDIDSNVWIRHHILGGTEALVIRIWSHTPERSEDEILTILAVYLSGLVFIGPQLGVEVQSLKPNSIIFLLPGGYYTTPCSAKTIDGHRYTKISASKEDVRPSYTLSMLNKLQSVQRSILENTTSAEALKQKIAIGDYITQNNRGSAMLRRIMNKTKHKTSHLDAAKFKEAVEKARYRVQILREEKARLLNNIRQMRERVDLLADCNQELESRTMENYRLLRREVQAHREWLKSYVERREVHVHSRALLNFRIKQLICELRLIYPIENEGENRFTICGVNLPDSENFYGHDDIKVSVALGFVAHTVQMISVFLQVPLRYPVVHMSSRSRIIDSIADKIPDSEREFPLYCKGKDRLQFNYAVYLLNKNIAQLRFLCGLGTYDLRCTLANVSSLLRLGGPESRNEVYLRSPSSSTLELVSPSSTTSTALDSNILQEKVPYPKRLGQFRSRIDGSPPGQSFMKMRSSTALHASESGVRPSLPTLTSNFSYSLDKGLNEFEEIKKKTGRAFHPEPISTAVPSNLGGSESSLFTCMPTTSARRLTSTAEEATTSAYLQNWESEKTNTPFSDEDSDANHSGIFTEKTVDNIDVSQSRSSVFDDIGEDSLAVGQEACDDSLIKLSGDIVIESSVQHVATCRSDMQQSSSENGQDALLENVTNRTEALASHASSFNLFRSRLRSTSGAN